MAQEFKAVEQIDLSNVHPINTERFPVVDQAIQLADKLKPDSDIREKLLATAAAYLALQLSVPMIITQEKPE